MPGSARLLFFAAWVCPTISLLFGDLAPDRIIAAVCAAGLTGALLSALPSPGFRAARLLTLLLMPLSWLWIAYVSLNGTGPSAVDALGTLANTNTAESWTALRLMANGQSITIALLQLTLLVGSWLCGTPRFSGGSTAVLAAALVLLMLTAWMPIVSAQTPAALPTRADWQNFPYGSMADIVGAWVTHPELAHATAKLKRRVPIEPAVTQPIDAIFVLGETFRFERDWQATDKDDAWGLLARRFRAGLGVMLPKVCASADATAISLPMILSGVSPENYDEVDTAPSGLARLAAAGYATAWISNQGRAWFDDEGRNLVWLSRGDAGAYDDVVLPVASAFLARKDPRNKALLIHLMDSHAAYAARYPPTAEPAGLDREQQEMLRYRRANDHTLSVLARLAALLDALPKPAFAVYVSDHGENLLADHNGIHFHIGARTTAKAAYVPSFVFWNAAFRQTSNPKARLGRDLAAPSLAHVDVYNIWMNFAGLEADLAPTIEPKILGKAKLTDARGPVSCSSLLP
jgi:glucan phosphoethanolaminetransferase (alkaline phosphatase superfamily)